MANKIREVVDNYTESIGQNPSHIAYDLLDNDPLNDNSVNGLCSQAEIYHEQVATRLENDPLDRDLENQYAKTHLNISSGFPNLMKNLISVENGKKENKVVSDGILSASKRVI